MEGYCQKITKTAVFVKFGDYVITMPKGDVKIIMGKSYTDLKSRGLLSPLHEIKQKSKAIRVAIRKSRKDVGIKEKETIPSV